MEVWRNPTPSGTWDTFLPLITKNEMTTIKSPAYSPQSVFAIGGTVAGGTLRDLVEIVTPTATAQAFTAGGSSESKRGVSAATTGYYKITNTSNGTVTGIFRLEREERP